MSMDVEETLTHLEHARWVVDHAEILDLPAIDEHGRPDPNHHPAPPRPAADVLDAAIRLSRRGVTRIGLTARLFLILLIVAALDGRTTIKNMHKIATGKLPRELQWELGILTRDPGTGATRELSRKQLYDMAEATTRCLDVKPDLIVDKGKRTAHKITEQEMAERRAIVIAISQALIEATHILPHAWSSYAVDDTGVWSWTKGKRKPDQLPDVDPTDEDLRPHPAPSPAEMTDLGDPDLRTSRDDDDEPDEDGLFGAAAAAGTPSSKDEGDRHAEPAATEPDEAQPGPTGPGDTQPGPTAPDAPRRRRTARREKQPGEATRPRKAPIACWFAKWGVKTHKTGKRSAFHGYAMHTLLRVPDVIKGGGKGARTDSLAEPMLIEAMEVTGASTDVVDVTLRLIHRVKRRGLTIVDLIGDRHYSYKKYHRWLARLWALGIRQVLDLRKNDHGVVDYNGAQIIAGWPHCGVPDPLIVIQRPDLSASDKEIAEFTRQLNERKKYAMARIKTAWQDGDGKTRWRCPARNGTCGCPRVEGSVQIALENNLPTVTPPETHLLWCLNDTATIEAGPHMKYHQQETWGLHDWLISWNRRTYVEGAYGNLKNHHTGNIHRGFMCFTGFPLVYLALTAAVVAYQLRELENCHPRHQVRPDQPHARHLPDHPLHQRTRWQDGFSMLTPEQAAAIDRQWAQHDRTGAQDPDEIPPAA